MSERARERGGGVDEDDEGAEGARPYPLGGPVAASCRRLAGARACGQGRADTRGERGGRREKEGGGLGLALFELKPICTVHPSLFPISIMFSFYRKILQLF